MKKKFGFERNFSPCGAGPRPAESKQHSISINVFNMMGFVSHFSIATRWAPSDTFHHFCALSAPANTTLLLVN